MHNLTRPTASLAIATASIIATAVQAQTQVAARLKIMPRDPAPSAVFGAAIAVDGPHALVGAAGVEVAELPDAGVAYLFNSATGEQRFRLSPARPGREARFGSALAIEGDTIVVGAPGESEVEPDAGAIYVFDAATGEQQRVIFAGDAMEDDGLGQSVDISGGRIVAGAPLASRGAFFSGAAYVFDAATGEQLLRLQPGDIQELVNFGWKVAISGNIIAVTSWRDSTRGRNAGAVYLFDATTGQQLHKLLPLTTEDAIGFGSALDLDGGLVLVGAPGVQDGEGRTYTFNAATGELVVEMAAPMPRSAFLFGQAVGILGDLAVIGEPNGFNTDAFYYNARTGELIAELVADRSAVSDSFGYQLAVGPGSAIVGAPSDAVAGFDSGVAYLFDLPAPDCRADLDGDGELTFFDFLAFQNLFAAGDLRADFDGSGSLDFFDFVAFQNEFAAGCP